MINIIIGCEESQAVASRFRDFGFNAYSCDLLACSGGHPEYHFQMDIFDVLKCGHLITQSGDAVFIDKWAMAVFFPDCTYLTVTANKWLKDQPERASGALVGAARRSAREDAISFFIRLYNCDIPLIAMENPVGCISSVFKKPTQIIQPYEYGFPETKKTCLWLQGLPALKPTNVVEPVFKIANGKKYSPTHYNPTDENGNRCVTRQDRAKIRSKTYAGIAEAMAQQWGDYLKQTVDIFNDDFNW